VKDGRSNRVVANRVVANRVVGGRRAVNDLPATLANNVLPTKRKQKSSNYEGVAAPFHASPPMSRTFQTLTP
jgi:hypothetical protein